VVLTKTYYAPTQIISNGNFLTNLNTVVNGRSWNLVTSTSWCDQGLPGKLADRLGKPISVIGDVPSNPPESFISDISSVKVGEVVVAVGGGSVMDGAKALVAASALGKKRSLLIEHLRLGTPLPADLKMIPLICVPTTAGTGSEVTRWATIWGEANVKYSLTHNKLYPEFAILSPEMCVSMDYELTLSSGLDAVSHAMEAVWNRNHNIFSDQMACAALTILYNSLERCLRDASDLESRAQVQSAATIAGLAMSTTQTALCHSISYPFTSLFSMPHGLACSFTLGAVCRFNMKVDIDRLKPIASAFSLNSTDKLPDTINAWLIELGIGQYLEKYVNLKDLDTLDENLITRARSKNNLRDVDEIQAKNLAKEGIMAFIPG